MTALKTEDFPVSLEGFDPETREAAREAASRAGVTLDEWVTTAIAERAKRPDSFQMGAASNASPPSYAKPASGSTRQPRTDRSADRSTAFTQRSPEPESKLSEAGQHGLAVARERVEERLAEMPDTVSEPIPHVSPATERVPRPIGRRGMESSEEVRNAVLEIRSRQRELDTRAMSERGRGRRADADIFSSLQNDIARLASQLDTVRQPSDPHAPTITALKSEIGRLRDSVAGLATRNQIGTLEQSVQALAAEVARARMPGDVAEVAAPVEELRAEIGRLSKVIRGDIHGRVGRDLDRIAAKISAAADNGVDPTAIDGLSQQLADVRRSLEELAEPRQIEALAAGVTELSRQVAELRSAQVDPNEFKSLKLTLEDIRTGMRRSSSSSKRPLDPEVAGSFGVPENSLDMRGERSADLDAAAPNLKRAGSDAVLEKIDALSSKLDGLMAGPQAELTQTLHRLSNRMDSALAASGDPTGISGLAERLDRLDEVIRKPAPSDLKPIEEMLRSLAVKLERAEQPGAGREALDALESQVSLIAKRLERNSDSDPALASLEQAMAHLRSDHSASDQRLNATLQGVHTTLEKLVSRLAVWEQDLVKDRGEARPIRSKLSRPAVPTTKADSPESATTAPAALLSGDADPDASLPEADRPLPAVESEDVPLEPGTGRPLPGMQASPEAAQADAELGDIKASFIAAARRAAQTAAAEAADTNKGKNGSRLARISSLPRGATDETSLAARVKGVIEKQRRPILLGLAAVVLALGAFQAVNLFVSDQPATTAANVPGRSEPAGRTDSVSKAPAESSTSRSGSGREVPLADIVEPRTTQSLASGEGPAPPSAQDRGLEANPVEPARQGLATAEAKTEPTPPSATADAVANATPTPGTSASLETGLAASARIPNMTAADIPASVGPSGLRQAALTGDPAAVHELASRAADGRGMARDLKLAAKLFEKAAAFGLAPAQYRIGNQYEKGLGVQRDLAAAKLWYQRAADKGNARAMHNLAVLLAEAGGARPDYAAAAGWFRRAAEYGVRDSQFNLGVLLGRGLGVTQDLVQSYTWFAVAAGQGDEDAAKKRDEVAGRLSATDLNTAKTAVERWKPAPLDQAANEVAPPVPQVRESPLKRPSTSDRV